MSCPKTYEVLLVEDNPADARLTLDALDPGAGGDAFRVHEVRTFGEALEALRTRRFDVILLDLVLPDARGLEAVTHLVEHTPDLPILVLSGVDDERLSLEAVLNGAQDCLIKGQGGPGILRRAIRHAIERKRLERELDRMAKYDPLTGLGNRVLFEDRLSQTLRRARHGDRLVALIYIDLDGFKAVNDRYGHAAGDQMLKAVAGRLVEVLRRTDSIARLGGDEFTVILEGLNHERDAVRVAEKVLTHLRAPYRLGDVVITLGASLGIAVATPAKERPETLTERADAAMYLAKARGGTGYYLQTPGGGVAAPTHLLPMTA